MAKSDRGLSNEMIRKSVFSGLKYVFANIYTSGMLFAFLFIITVIIGFETDAGVVFFNGSILHTMMLPLIVWYFGYLAYREGYRHSVAGNYDMRRIIIPCVMVFAFQAIIVGLAISEEAGHVENGVMSVIATFLMSPYRILFDYLEDYMPVVMMLPTPVASIAIYEGYKLSRKKEIDDHLIKDDAKSFRAMLEEQQYNRNKQDGDNK